MFVYSDTLTAPDIRDIFHVTGLWREGVYLHMEETGKARKRRNRTRVKLSADPGVDRFGTRRRWANSGKWGAQTPSNGYLDDSLGDKAATYNEWGVFIKAVFERDPEAIVGQYNTPAELESAWTEPKVAT